MEEQVSCRSAHNLPSRASRRRRKIGLCAFVALVAASCCNAEGIIDAAVDVTYDSNLTRAGSSADVRSDAAVSGDFAPKWVLALDESGGATLGADFGGQHYLRYRGLDNAWIGVTAAYRHKTGLGYGAPWVLVEASAAYHDYNVNLRTGPRFYARAECGKRFSEALDAHVGVFFERRRSVYGEPEVPGIPGTVFDGRGSGIDVGAAFAVTETLVISGALAARRGDVVSTTSRGLAIFNASTAIAEDSTFGDELYAYRLRGTTNTVALTASWALDDRSSLNIGYTGERTRVAQGLDYRSNLARLAFLYRY